MLYITATYQVKKQSIVKVKKAIKNFTKYVKDNEPGTLLYLAWQKKGDPTTFLHFFIFKNRNAQDIHSRSDAVKKFESVYSPVLVSKGVNFEDFELVASNSV